MRLRKSLGLAAAAAVGLSFTSGAFAAGIATPNTTLLYSAQSIRLAASSNTVTLPSTTFPGGGYLGYIAPGVASIAIGASVSWSAPAADTWTITDPATAAGGTGCFWFTGPGAVGLVAITTPAGSGTSTITCTNAAPVAGAVAVSAAVNLATFGAFTGNKVSLAGPDVAQLAANTFAGLTPLSGTTSAQSAVVQINGTGPGDPAGGIPILALNSKNSFSVTLVPNTLLVDLGGSGLPAIAPGAGFLQPLANGTRPVSRAGYLGALWVNVAQTDLDARTGTLGINNPTPAAIPPSQTAITGTVSTTLSGDFATITSAYLVPNNNGVPNENTPACTATAPANALAGTIDAVKRSIVFATFPTSPNTAGSGAQPTYGVCLVTNGTQVIQESPAVGAPAPNTIQIVVSTLVTGITTPYFLTPAPSTAFGSIAYQGSVFLAQNVFGANNLYPTFFRVVNGSNAAVRIWAILTKDVPNVVPETGAGSCADPGGITATCNIAFVANLTALTDPTGLSKGLIQPNTAVYYTADAIAALAGTSLPASSLHATVHLLSPSTGVRFSAVSQNPITLDLISVP